VRALLLLTAACGLPPEPVPLSSPDAWTVLLDAADPLADERPATARVCGEGDVFVEGETLEISTEACDWASFGQPVPVRMGAGDVVTIGLAHLDLWAPEAAEAVLAVGVGDTELVRWRRRIPSGAGILDEEVVLDDHVAAGDPMWIHVHNHGINSYRLTRLTGRRP
jgi:hypothetical protein